MATGSGLASLSLVVTNDDDPAGGSQSLVTFDAIAGTTYLISVDGYNGSSGTIVLGMSGSPADTNPPVVVSQSPAAEPQSVR